MGLCLVVGLGLVVALGLVVELGLVLGLLFLGSTAACGSKNLNSLYGKPGLVVGLGLVVEVGLVMELLFTGSTAASRQYEFKQSPLEAWTFRGVCSCSGIWTCSGAWTCHWSSLHWFHCRFVAVGI